MTEDKEIKEIKDLLKKSLETTQDNSKTLHKLNSARVRSNIFKFVKFLVIIGIAFGSFYYVEPYLNKAMDALTNVTSGLDELQKTTKSIGSGAQDLQNALPEGFFDKIGEILKAQ
jgi:non-homologous end joining protein Ku